MQSQTQKIKLFILVQIYRLYSCNWAIATRFDLAQGSHQAKKTMKVSKKSGKHSTGKFVLQAHKYSNYIKTCSTTPNTGKFARVKGWAKKHKCSIACDHTTGRLIKTRSNKISWELAKFSKVYTKWSLTRQSTINYEVCQKSAPYFNAITNTKNKIVYTGTNL